MEAYLDIDVRPTCLLRPNLHPAHLPTLPLAHTLRLQAMRPPPPQLFEALGARRETFVPPTAPPPFASYNNAPYYQPYPTPALSNPYGSTWHNRAPRPWLGEDATRGDAGQAAENDGEGRSSFDWGPPGSRQSDAPSMATHHHESAEDRPASRSPFGHPDTGQWGSQAPLPPPQSNPLAGLASFANYYEESYRRSYDVDQSSASLSASADHARSPTNASDNTSDGIAEELAVASTSTSISTSAAAGLVVRKVRRPRKPRRRADEEPRDFAHRRYTCEVCGPKGEKTFARPSALALHMVRPSPKTRPVAARAKSSRTQLTHSKVKGSQPVALLQAYTD